MKRSNVMSCGKSHYIVTIRSIDFHLRPVRFIAVALGRGKRSKDVSDQDVMYVARRTKVRANLPYVFLSNRVVPTESYVFSEW